MGDETEIGGQPDRAGVNIATGDPPTVKVLAEREGLDPVEKLRREFENKLAMFDMENRLSRYRLLRDVRRKLCRSVKTREELQRDEKQHLADVEREMRELNIPPALLKKIQ